MTSTRTWPGRSRRGMLLLMAMASLTALTALMLSVSHRVHSAAVVSRRVALESATPDDLMGTALARSMLHLRKGQLTAGSSYRISVEVGTSASDFRLDCEIDANGNLTLTCTPAPPADLTGLPLLEESTP